MVLYACLFIAKEFKVRCFKISGKHGMTKNGTQLKLKRKRTMNYENTDTCC